MANTKKSHKKGQQKSLNFSPKIRFLPGLLLILLGAIILIYPAFLKSTSPSKSQQAFLSIDQSLQKPTKIFIPKMKRILYVSDGFVQNDRWAISETGVSYYTNSALPGQGNTVIYGHNTKDKLGGLWRVSAGDQVYIVLANGDFVKYQITETKEVKPTQVEILVQTDEKRLTLYTCSGFLDRARFVVTANQVAI